MEMFPSDRDMQFYGCYAMKVTMFQLEYEVLSDNCFSKVHKKILSLSLFFFRLQFLCSNEPKLVAWFCKTGGLRAVEKAIASFGDDASVGHRFSLCFCSSINLNTL
jgi:hypothetical protein